MTALALVLLVLGFLFATLQYPDQMRRFWKWALIGAGSLALVAAVAIAAINMKDSRRIDAASISFDDLIPKKDAPGSVPDAFAHLPEASAPVTADSPCKEAPQMIEVEGPDGVIHKFPDGTTKDVIVAMMTKLYPAAQQAKEPQPSKEVDRIDLLLEAERRGLLPQDKLEALQKARGLGIVPAALSDAVSAGAASQAQKPDSKPDISFDDLIPNKAGPK